MQIKKAALCGFSDGTNIALLFALQALSILTMPTLVIVGTGDIIKADHSKLIANSIPNAKFSRIKGNHFITAKKSIAFNTAVITFLEEHEHE